MKTFNDLIWILIFFICCLFQTTDVEAQTYFFEITENQYYKISSGNLFYEGQIQLNDDSIHKGWVSRFPDSNTLRFRSVYDSIRVYTLTSKDVKSFCYELKDSTPNFIFTDLPITKRKTKTRSIELLVDGDLNLYVYKTVQDVPYANALLQTKHVYQMLMDFYVEKNNELHYMYNFEKDLVSLIKDKKDYYQLYKETKKNRRDADYVHFVNAIIKYNEIE